MQVGDKVTLDGATGTVTALDNSLSPPMAQVCWEIYLNGWVPQDSLNPANGDQDPSAAGRSDKVQAAPASGPGARGATQPPARK